MKQFLLFVAVPLVLAGIGSCKEQNNCADLQASNYNPNATEKSAVDACDYSAVTFYAASLFYTNTTDTNKLIDSVVVYLNQNDITQVTDRVAVFTDSISGTPDCYIPSNGVVKFENTLRRPFMWSVTLYLNNGSRVTNARYGHFEPDKQCQVINVYP